MVKIKSYPGHLLTLDFYRKIKSHNRYKLLSSDFKFGYVGATVLDIMKDVQTKSGANTFGMIAASLLEEGANSANKRYIVYTNILRRKVDATKYKVFGAERNSIIFVVPIERVKDRDSIFSSYEKIFSETN